MKKIIQVLSILLFLCINTKGQSEFAKRDTIIPDTKYWFSQTQLNNSVAIASKTRHLVMRCYIDNIEFTESGYTKAFGGPKDSRLVARKHATDTLRVICRYMHPDDVKVQNLNTQFIRWSYPQ